MSTGSANVTNKTQVTSSDSAANYVQKQLDRTQLYLKLVEFVTSILVLVTFLLGALFVLAVIDAWVIGLNRFARWVICLGIGFGSLAFLARSLGPLIFKRINPLYAAKMIEGRNPGLKNSVLNFLTLGMGRSKRKRSKIEQAVSDAVGFRAATDLSRTPIESSIDLSKLIWLGYVLVGIMVVGGIYKVQSPKDPFQTVIRVIAPMADAQRPSKVKIISVTPGDSTVFYGERVEVEVELKGVKKEEPVQLRFSTLDGRILDRVVNLQPKEGRPNSFQGQLATGATGVQQSLRYSIEAGDAKSRLFELKVQAKPTIAIEEIRMEYPEYTGLPTRTLDGLADVRGVEGTRVKLKASANLPIERAVVELIGEYAPQDESASPSRRVVSTVKMVVDGNQASGEFRLLLNPERTAARFSHFRLRFTSVDGDRNERPDEFRVQVLPDLAPEIFVREPEDREVFLPIDRSLKVVLDAYDPDFLISAVRLESKFGETLLDNKSLLEAGGEPKNRVMLETRWYPFDYDLSVGDEVRLTGIVEDNRQSALNGLPEPNVTRAPMIIVRLTEAVGGPDPLDASESNDGDASGEGEATAESGSENGNRDERSANSNNANQNEGGSEAENSSDSSNGGDASNDNGASDSGSSSDRNGENSASGTSQQNESGTEGSSASSDAGADSSSSSSGGAEGEQSEQRTGESQESGQGGQGAGGTSAESGGSQSSSGDATGGSSTNSGSSSSSQAGDGTGTNSTGRSQNGATSSGNVGDEGTPSSSPEASGGETGQGGGAGNGGSESASDAAGERELHEGDVFEKIQEFLEEKEGEGSSGSGANGASTGGSQGSQGESSQNSPENQSSEMSGAGSENGSNASSGQDSAGDSNSNNSSGDSSNTAQNAGGGSDPTGDGSSGSSQADNETSASQGGSSENGTSGGGGQKEPQASGGQDSGGGSGGAQSEQQTGSGGQEESSGGGGSPPAGQQSAGQQGDSNASGGGSEDGEDQQGGSGGQSSGGGSGDDNSQDSQESGGGAGESGSDSGNEQGSSGQQAGGGQEGGQEAGGSSGAQQSGGDQPGGDSGSQAGGDQPGGQQPGSQGNTGSTSGGNGGDSGNNGTGQGAAEGSNESGSTSSEQPGGPQSGATGDSGASGNNDPQGPAGGSQGNASGDTGTGAGSTPGETQQPNTNGQPKPNQSSEQPNGEAGSQGGSGSNSSSGGTGSTGQDGDGRGESAADTNSPNPGSGSEPAASESGREGADSGNSNPGNSNASGNPGARDSGTSDPSAGDTGTGRGNSSSGDRVGQAGNNRGSGSADPLAPAELPEGDEANLDYARKATDLVLDYLKDQKTNPDPDLLERLNWTPEELDRFVEQWSAMKERAAQGDNQAQRQLDDRLRSLGLRSGQDRQIGSNAAQDNVQRLEQSGTRSRPPAEYAEMFRAFLQGTSRSTPAKNQ